MKWQYILLVIVTAIVVSTVTVVIWLAVLPQSEPITNLNETATPDTSSTETNSDNTVPEVTTNESTNRSTDTADTTVTGNEDGHSCDQDYVTYCQDTPPGKINLVNCLLNEHYDEISDACKQSLERRQQLNEDLVAACAADRGEFCKGVEPQVGSQPMVDCLGEHYEELSSDCAAAYDAHEASKLTQ